MRPTHYEKFAKVTAGLVPGVDNPTRVLDMVVTALSKHCSFGKVIKVGKFTGQEMNVDPKVHSLFPKDTVGWLMLHCLLSDHKVIAPTLVRYYRQGKKTFNVSRGLTEMLHDTDISGTYEHLKLPFPSFYINFDKCPIHVTFDGEEEEVAGVYVSEQADKITFMAVGLSLWSRSCVTPGEVGPDAPVSMDDFNQGDQEAHNPAVELAVKILLYLNSSEPDVKEGDNGYGTTAMKLKKAKEQKKRERLTRHLERLSALEYFDVGRSIKVSKHADDKVERVEYEGGFHYSHRFWVRGHFRNQACGKNREERRLMWIQPYMKGPDQAAIVHRQYDVG